MTSMLKTIPTNDFSTNRHSAQQVETTTIIRHPELSFNDGNIAIHAGKYYFLVHQGVLSRQSEVLEKTISALSCECSRFIEGRPVLQFQDSLEEVKRFLQALYDGITFLTYNANDFPIVSGLLRLFTKYKVDRLRAEALRGLSNDWPLTLLEWEARELKATNASGLYTPRKAHPHPILVIKLAREIDAPELLPSAFYDLSRSLPSDASAGCVSSESPVPVQLSDADLLNLLKGREHASRFLSTFIVNEMEGREPSAYCLHRHSSGVIDRRTCHAAFEAITFEILRDCNGVVCDRNSDPLYAIAEAELIQTRDDIPGMENTTPYHACEVCRADFGVVVDAARREFWRKIPEWFGVETPAWP